MWLTYNQTKNYLTLLVIELETSVFSECNPSERGCPLTSLGAREVGGTIRRASNLDESVFDSGCRIYIYIYIYVCVYIYICIYIYICVCVCEREREREWVCLR